MNMNSLKLHLVGGPVTYGFTLHMSLKVCWDSLSTPLVGLSQFHGHGSWLVCEVALSLDFMKAAQALFYWSTDNSENIHMMWSVFTPLQDDGLNWVPILFKLTKC